MTRRRVWPAISIAFGAVYAIEAVAHVPGVVFVITAIITGSTYAIVGVLTRE